MNKKLEISRQLRDTLPLLGDRVKSVVNGKAEYESGAVIELGNNTRVKGGDIVDGVSCIADKGKIIIAIDHSGSESIIDDSYQKVYERIRTTVERKEKIDIFLNEED